MLSRITRRFFCQNKSGIISVSQMTKETSQKQEQFLQEAAKTGSDLKLPQEMIKPIYESGILRGADFESPVGKKNWYLTYLKNMGLEREYSNIFRDFMQTIARQDNNYLDLVCEPRLADFMNSNLDIIRKKGYLIELENLKIKHDFEVIDWKLYKNLRVRREDNKKFVFENYGKKFSIAKYSEDSSFFDNIRPFVLSSTLKIRTPMKLVVYNQNFSAKIFGKGKDEVMEYSVKFETELGLSDLFWILPVQNKPSRERQTRIVDINDILKGNNFEEDKGHNEVKI